MSTAATSFTMAMADAVHRTVHGEAWHGPSLLEVLDDVPDDALHRRTAPAHTPAEIVLHTVAWLEEVTTRLAGGVPQLPARGDWSDASTFTRETLRRLVVDATTACTAAITAFPPDRLGEIVGGGAHDAPLGSGVTYATMLQGIAHHTAYHAGQVVLLARAAGAD